MSRALLRSTASLLALVLCSAGAHAFQGTLTVKPGSCDNRIDLNSVPRSGSSLHHIRFSGSYVLSSNIQCGAGQTAISIDPLASSVVIDFNGYAVMGDPGMSSVSGVSCPPCPSPRANLELKSPRIYLFGGDGIAVDSVIATACRRGIVTGCSTNGLRVSNSGSVVVEEMTIKNAGHGVAMSLIQNIRARTCNVSDCGEGMTFDAPEVSIADCTVSGCTGDGIVLESSGSSSGGVRRNGWDLKEATKVYDCGDDGIELRIPGGEETDVDCGGPMVWGCASNGLRVIVGTSSRGGPHVKVFTGRFCFNGGSGIDISSDSEIDVSLASTIMMGNGGSGFSSSCLKKAGYTLMNARGEDNVGAGFSITGTGTESMFLVGSECTANDNGGDGVLISGSCGGRATFSDLRTNRNAGSGLAMSCSGGIELAMSHVMASGNTLDGITVDAASGLGTGKCHIKDFHCSANQRDGIKLTATATLSDGLGNTNARHGLSVTDGSVDCSGVSLSENGDDGLHALRATCNFSDGSSRLNGGDGIEASSPPGGPATELVVRRSTLSDNQGFGCKVHDKASPKLCETVCKGNVAGGARSSSSGGCVPVQCDISQCSFESNGGIALDVQNAGGGKLERITILGSSTGIRVGDPSGTTCCSNVSVTDCSMSACGTGLQVLAGGHHLVLRNSASGCTVSPFSIAAGNTAGPVLSSSADLLATPNPFANFAP